MGANPGKNPPAPPIVPDSAELTIILKAGVWRALLASLNGSSALDQANARTVSTAIIRSLAVKAPPKKKGKQGSVASIPVAHK
jgi:hypothetical protein